MTFFVKMNASLIFKNDGGLNTDFEYFLSLIFKNDGGLNTDFEYFLKCTKSQKRTYEELI